MSDGTPITDARAGARLACHEIDWNNPGEGDLVRFVEQHYEDGKARRSMWEAAARTRVAWIKGQQDVAWDASVQDLRPISDGTIPLELRDTTTANRLRRYLHQWLGLMLAGNVTWTTMPQTADSDDLAGARLCGKLLAFYFGKSRGFDTLLTAFWWMLATGVSWLKPTWDPYAGERDTFDISLFQGDEDGSDSEAPKRSRLGSLFNRVRRRNGRLANREKPGVELPAGDFQLDVATGFDLTEPYGCYAAEDADWLIHSRYRSIEYLRDRYGDKAARLTADSHPDSRSGHFAETGRSGDESGAGLPLDDVLTHELWRPVCPACEKGLLAVVAQGTLLHQGTHPYAHGRLPFIGLAEGPHPDTFRASGSMDDLMSLQKGRNTLRRLAMAHVLEAAAPKWWNERGNGVDPNAYEGTGPKCIELNPGRGGSFGLMPKPPFPGEAIALDQAAVADMDDIAAMHAASQGKREHAQESALHAQIMVSSDLRSSEVTRQMIESAFAACGEQALGLLWQHVTTERTLRIIGDSGELELLSFRGTHLLGSATKWAPHAFNVQVTLGRAPDPSMEVERIEALTRLGYLNPADPADKARVLQALGDAYVGSEVNQEASAHRRNAALENRTLLKGDPVIVALGDDDAIHINAHLQFQAESSEFRAKLTSTKSNDRTMRLGFSLHIRAHMFNGLEKRLRPAMLAKKIEGELAAEYQLTPAMPAQARATTPAAGMPAGQRAPAQRLAVAPNVV